MATLQMGDGQARGGHGIGGKRATPPRATLAAFLTSASLGVLSLAMPAVAQVSAQSVTFDIPSQPVNEALVAFARQAGVRLVMPDAQFGNVRSNAVRGAYDRDTALAELLRGTGVAARLENGAIVLQRSADASRAVQGAAPDANDEPFQLAKAQPPRTSATYAAVDGRRSASNEADDDADKVVIVGTNIRGVYPASSPVEIFTADDIARTGAMTTEQFMQKLPQNLSSRNSNAPDAAGSTNREAINGVDLRGLGLGTTLVLLNGRRVSTAGDRQVVDISMIPVSALERVEVLTDGASAIYGSDAVGGVVNFILRDDLEGVETRANYGGVTSGGMRQGSATVSVGAQWNGGNALASVSYFSASALDNLERSYASARPGTLAPTDQRAGGFVSFDQDIGQNISLSGDFAYAQRAIKSRFTGANNLRFNVHSDSDQYFGNLSAQVRLGADLNASAHLTYSENDTDNLTRFVTNAGAVTNDRPDTYGRATDATVMLDGTAFALPAGDVRFSIGAGITYERFLGRRLPRRDLRRDTAYAFGELFVPLVSKAMDVPFAQRLELSLAARYTDYEDDSRPPLTVDFGGRTSPKLGVLWSPIDGLNVRGTYGESFRAAPLNQLDPTGNFNSIFRPAAAADIWSPTNQTVILNVLGAGNPNLGPETAESYTFGFDIEPPTLEGFRVSATYFNVEYQNRIERPDLSGLAAVRPRDFPDVFILNPTAAQMEEILRTSTNFSNPLGFNLSNPTALAAQLAALPSIVILDNRVRNLARSDVNGLDFSIEHSWTPSIGDVSIGAQATYILDYEQQVTPNAPVLTVVDTVLQPVDLRAIFYVDLSAERFNTRLAVNYVDSYDNPFNTARPEINSWTTLDWSGSYQLGGDRDGVRLRLSIQNLFDEDPPFVAQQTAAAGLGLRSPAGFDPVNANPLGRFVSFEVVKQW